jgi:hypothetical protein
MSAIIWLWWNAIFNGKDHHEELIGTNPRFSQHIYEIFRPEPAKD